MYNNIAQDIQSIGNTTPTDNQFGTSRESSKTILHVKSESSKYNYSPKLMGQGNERHLHQIPALIVLVSQTDGAHHGNPVVMQHILFKGAHHVGSIVTAELVQIDVALHHSYWVTQHILFKQMESNIVTPLRRFMNFLHQLIGLVKQQRVFPPQ